MDKSKIEKQLSQAKHCVIRSTGKQWHECQRFKKKKTNNMFQWSPCKYFYVSDNAFLCLVK